MLHDSNLTCTCRDCGLACVQMVIQAAGFSHCDYRLLRQLCTTTRCEGHELPAWATGLRPRDRCVLADYATRVSIAVGLQ